MKPVTKAKIKFCKFDNALAMQVIYLHDRASDMSSDEKYGKSYITIDGNCGISEYIRNRFMVSIGWLKGGYSDVTDENIALEIIIEALKDWAKNWGGWKDEPAIEPKITEYDGGVVMVEV